jgi:signal transduction histidine kinase
MHGAVRKLRPPQSGARVWRRCAAVLALETPLSVWAVEGSVPWPATPWFALSLASGVAGALLLWWIGQRQRHTLNELREARAEAQCLAELSDQWHWRSDHQHRLTQLRAPSGVAAPPWPPAAGLSLVWEVLAMPDAGALRACMDRHQALLDESVHLPSADGVGTQQPARLRGRIRTDERGAFAGYQGTLSVQPSELVVAAPSAATAESPAIENEHESFGYTISHDLRAPIRVVEGFTRILKEDYGRVIDRVGNDHLDRVLGAAARMNGMIDALLALSRLSTQPLARQPVNLTQLAGYVAEDLRRQSPGREVTLHVEPGLQVLGDPTLLRLVLENLLGNAWKYTGKSPAPEVWLERARDAADTFTVRDNGAGFDMRFADRLFGVFQRLHSASDFQGTGVGLASVRRIVRRHGGDVWAEAEVDRGASFHFSLPQTAPAV